MSFHNWASGIDGSVGDGIVSAGSRSNTVPIETVTVEAGVRVGNTMSTAGVVLSLSQNFSSLR